MRHRYILSAIWMCALTAHAMHPSQMLPRPLDEIIVNEMTQPILPAELEVLVLMQPEQCTPRPGDKAPTFAALIRWTACDAFMASFKDSKAILPLHSYQLDTVPSSAKATLEAGKQVLSGRRYVAMIMWDAKYRGMSTPGCDPCSYPVHTPMEIAVMDTQTGRKIWHSHHAIRMMLMYNGRAIEARQARLLGVNNMERLVNLVLSQRQHLALDSIGMHRTRGFLMTDETMKPPPLNPDARLIMVNNDDFNGTRTTEVRFTVMLSALPPLPQVKVLYNIPLHGFVALNLPAGKYALQVSKETTQEIEIGTAPVYLSLKSPQLMDRQEVRAIGADELLDLSADMVNVMIPEMTPASWQVKKKQEFFWPQP